FLSLQLFRNEVIASINQLLTTLRLYATGGHLSSVADYMGIHTSTACRIVQRVSKGIASLYKEVVKIPSSIEEIKQSQNEFYNKKIKN
ncbi:HTH 23 domain containing protein, partial [Asbolus verrucosus]